jgi:long-chain acyl-CoA synthetase
MQKSAGLEEEAMDLDIGKLDTFPKLLAHHAQARGALPAIREKDLGIWQTWTWQRFSDEARALACGLAAQGLQRGDHIAVVGDNRPRIYAAIAAAQCLGAIPVPLYQDAVAAEMAFPIQNAEIAHAVVEDQEQVDKLLEILPGCPTLKRIYFDDTRGMRHYKQPELMSYDKLVEGKVDAAFIDAEIAKGKGSDTAAMFFTSGTTGVPKGVVLTHHSLIDARSPSRRWRRSPNATWSSHSCRRHGSARTSFPTPSRSLPATASAARKPPRP